MHECSFLQRHLCVEKILVSEIMARLLCNLRIPNEILRLLSSTRPINSPSAWIIQRALGGRFCGCFRHISGGLDEKEERKYLKSQFHNMT